MIRPSAGRSDLLKTIHALAFAGALALFAGSASATPQDAPKLPLVSPIFGDNMVLQRGKPNTIWGWSEPGDSIRVELGENSATAAAAADGKWQTRIQPPAPGGPYTLRISGKQQKIELHDVLVGDVWLCAGQSNMQFGLAQARNGAEEVKRADYPQIRYYVVGQRTSYSHVDVPRGSWRVVSPATVGGRGGGISAVAYFFARKLQQNVHVPIGLVHEAVGGVPAETFTSPDALRPLKDFDDGLAEVERRHAKGDPEYGNYIMHWYDEFDIGSKGTSWADPSLDDSSWKTVHIPGGFKELGVGEVPSLTYFRKEITLPETLPPGMARLYLGSIDKMDTAYINGRQVGASSWVENPRVYFAGSALKPGRNLVTLRIFKVKPSPGFLGAADEIRLVLGDGSVIPLAGEWKGKVSVDARPPQPLPIGYDNLPRMPGVLYRGMVAPIVPLAVTGAIWYQGESNAERAYQYRKLLPAMIADWRKQFGQGDFPFYVVGLPAYQRHRDTPGDDSWAEMREAQFLTVKNVPNTCLAVTIDTGNPDNIHPIDKIEPGERLAACALAQHYGQKVPFAGPTLASVDRLPGALKLRFDHTDGGLVVKGDKLGEFSVAGDDRKWHWAEARIEGDSVIVSSKDVPDPKQARYAWQSYPLATLFNAAGFPAVPLRTDDWPGVTVGRIKHDF